MLCRIPARRKCPKIERRGLGGASSLGRPYSSPRRVVWPSAQHRAADSMAEFHKLPHRSHRLPRGNHERIFLIELTSVSEMQADGRGRARFLCGLALWMITVAAAHRHGANARMLHRRDTWSDCAGHGKFDCLDRRAPLRMLGGYRARRFARLHIRMLNDGDGGAALPAPTPWRRSQVPPDPHGANCG